MCIIVYKPSNVAFPSWATLQTCFENNPDGAGFMYAIGGMVYGFKGFMKWQDFKQALKAHKRDGVPFVIHFRITTHGGTSKEMCHPFPLSDYAEDMKLTAWRARVGIAHNGVIPMCNGGGGYSDTAEFISTYGTALIDSETWYNDARKIDLLEECIASKMCVLSGNGHAQLVGDFEKADGVYYSNSSYKTARRKSYTWQDYSAYDWYNGYAYGGAAYDYDSSTYGAETSRYMSGGDETEDAYWDGFQDGYADGYESALKDCGKAAN